MARQGTVPIALTLYQGETLEQYRVRFFRADGTTPYPIGGARFVATLRPKSGGGGGGAAVTWSTDDGRLTADPAASTLYFSATADDTAPLPVGHLALGVGIVTAEGAAHNLLLGTVTVLAAAAALTGALAPPLDAQETFDAIVTLPVPVPPALVTAPTIAGTVATGQTLTVATPGVYSGTAPFAYSYQWLADGAPIPNATGTSYVVKALDQGPVITVRETATNSAGSATALSANSRQWAGIVADVDMTTPAGAARLVVARTGGDLYLQASATTLYKLAAGGTAPWEDRGDGLPGVWTFAGYTNVLTAPLDRNNAAWTKTAGTTVQTGEADPTGGTGAVRLRDADPAGGKTAFQVLGSYPCERSTWVRDYPGDAPTAPGMLAGDTNAVTGASFGTGLAWRRVVLHSRSGVSGMGTQIHGEWIAGASPGALSSAATGSVVLYAGQSVSGTVDLPMVEGTTGASAPQLATADAAKLVQGGNLDVEVAFTPRWASTLEMVSGYLLSANSSSGQIAVRYDATADRWFLTARGADVALTNSQAPNAAVQTVVQAIRAGQECRVRAWYRPSVGDAGLRVMVNGAIAFDATGTATAGALVAPTAAWLGSNGGSANFLAVQLTGHLRIRASGAALPLPAEGLVLGDSTVASYLKATSLASNVYTIGESRSRGGIVSLAVPGDTIAGQQALFAASPYRTTVAWVLLQIGLNNVTNTAGSSAAAIAALQGLVDAVNLANPAAKVVLCTLTPAHARWETLYGAGAASANAKDNWTAINAAITGGGITGVDAVISEHTALLDVTPAAPSGYLNASYETAANDHIHYNDAAHLVVGQQAWRPGLQAAGLL